LYAFIYFPTRSSCPVHLIFLGIISNIWRDVQALVLLVCPPSFEDFFFAAH
jgi:hypothetical protein